MQSVGPLLKENEKLEADLALWQQEKGGIDSRMTDPALYEPEAKQTLQTLINVKPSWRNA